MVTFQDLLMFLIPALGFMITFLLYGYNKKQDEFRGAVEKLVDTVVEIKEEMSRYLEKTERNEKDIKDINRWRDQAREKFHLMGSEMTSMKGKIEK
jgi:predicted  nucleic acid-binding Zn-ribbon protein